MTDALLIVGIVLGTIVAFVTFVLNGNTPLQIGPVPFLAGLTLAVVCCIALIARIVTGH